MMKDSGDILEFDPTGKIVKGLKKYRVAYNIVIPDGCTTIAKDAFKDRELMTSIIIPESVTIIEDNAFAYCKSLESIKLPSSLESLGDCAFYGCRLLKSILIPNKIKRLGTMVFAYCDNLESVELPEGISVLGHSLFFGCRRLTSINVPQGLKYIGEDVFYLCDKLKINIPSNVEPLKDEEVVIDGLKYRLSDKDTCDVIRCSEILGGEVVIPDMIRSCKVVGIDQFTFLFGCNAFNTIRIGRNIKYIPYDVFRSCVSLSDIIVDPDNTVFFSHDGVLFHKKRKELLYYPLGKTNACYKVPDWVTRISIDAFRDCTKLEKIILPKSLEKIDGALFRDDCPIDVMCFAPASALSYYTFPDSAIIHVSGDDDYQKVLTTYPHIPDWEVRSIMRSYDPYDWAEVIESKFPHRKKFPIVICDLPESIDS